MKRIGLIVLLVAATACGAGDSTGPSTVISIRLLDDAGASAGRNKVVVTLADSTRVTASTGNRGTVDVTVPGAGFYVVSVIARNAYVGSSALTRSVDVAENGKTQVEFTLYRGGSSIVDPPPEGDGR